MNEHNDSLRKAAILIDSLDRHSADALLEQMSAVKAAQVRNEVMRLGDISSAERERIIDEFLSGQRTAVQDDDDGIELDDSLAAKLAASHFIHTDGNEAVDEHTDPPPFRFLHEAATDALVPVLRYEHPQTVAVIISHLTPQRAADLIGRLPAQLQAEVLRRVVELDDTDPEVIQEIEQEIESLLCEQIHSVRRRSAGLAAASAILNAADFQDRHEILSNLGNRDQDLAQRLSGHDAQISSPPVVLPLSRSAFASARPAEPDNAASDSFDHVVNLDDRSLSQLLRTAEPKLAILALIGAPHSFVQRILRQLPTRQAKSLEKQMEQSGPLRLRDIEHAQKYLTALAIEMAREVKLDSSATRRFAAAA